MINILILEDDIKINNLYRTVITNEGFNVFSAFNVDEALSFFDSHTIDLVITDIMLPNIDGYEFVRILRNYNSTLPILMITAKDQFDSKRKAFNLGIDDYMIKPIDTNEMVLRVHALLRRAKIATEHQVSIGDALLDLDELSVSLNEVKIYLPQKEFKILYKLVSYPNKIFTRQQLMDEIWGYDYETDERTVDVHINRLRDRLKDFNDISLITVRGLGYKVMKI